MIRTKNKYHSKKIVKDGLTFDSQKEYKRYCELVLLEKAGQISNLQRQVKYVLIPAQREPDRIGKRGGKLKGDLIERECSYKADFVYLNAAGEKVVEDAKGMRTKEYIIKRKLMLFIHRIRVKEV